MSRPLAAALLVALGAAAAALVVVLGFATAGAGEATADPGFAAPPILETFDLPTLDGSRLGPADLRGDVVVVEFWATWCMPCKVQATILDGMHEEYRDREVSFLALNTGEDADLVRRHVEASPFGYPVLLDPGESVLQAAGIVAVPVVMVLDPQGEVSFLSVGLTGASVLRQAIDQALATAA